jgi:hypothetical protein
VSAAFLQEMVDALNGDPGITLFFAATHRRGALYTELIYPGNLQRGRKVTSCAERVSAQSKDLPFEDG